MKIILSVLFVFIGFGYGMAGTFEEALKLYNDKNYEAALKMFEDVCKAGDNHACDELARIYFNGTLVGIPTNPNIKTDYPKALSFFTLACDRNYGKACFHETIMYAHGLGTNKNTDKVFQLSEKSCNLNYGLGCAFAGLIYGQVKGYADFAKAKKLSERGCNLKDPCSCFDLGTIFFLGRGVAKDMDKASYYTDLSNEYGVCPRSEKRRIDWGEK